MAKNTVDSGYSKKPATPKKSSVAGKKADKAYLKSEMNRLVAMQRAAKGDMAKKRRIGAQIEELRIAYGSLSSKARTTNPRATGSVTLAGGTKVKSGQIGSGDKRMNYYTNNSVNDLLRGSDASGRRRVGTGRPGGMDSFGAEPRKPGVRPGGQDSFAPETRKPSVGRVRPASDQGRRPPVRRGGSAPRRGAL